jgi:flagellar motor switch protein FliN/FliY
MAAFTEANVESILAAVSGNAASLAESLSQCFHKSYRIEPGESGIWSGANAPADLNNPGVVALLQVETQGLAVLIPESLPLPDWYAHPNDSEKARLETLAMEWSMNLLPPENEAEKFRSLVVADLALAVNSMAPAEWAAMLELNVYDAQRPATEPLGRLFVVWPLMQPNFEFPEANLATTPEAVALPGRAAAPPPTPQHVTIDPLARLRRLPVQISVRLAEKKIPMQQLLSITPGMLITFNKSCEDLLDLYVNNSCYCRGEAVKIGENFGLKINQLGGPPETPPKVIDA